MKNKLILNENKNSLKMLISAIFIRKQQTNNKEKYTNIVTVNQRVAGSSPASGAEPRPHQYWDGAFVLKVTTFNTGKKCFGMKRK